MTTSAVNGTRQRGFASQKVNVMSVLLPCLLLLLNLGMSVSLTLFCVILQEVSAIIAIAPRPRGTSPTFITGTTECHSDST